MIYMASVRGLTEIRMRQISSKRTIFEYSRSTLFAEGTASRDFIFGPELHHSLSKQDLGFEDCEVERDAGANASGLHKVWILTEPIGCMNGTRRFDLREHLSEADLDTAINDAQKADEARLVRRLCFVKNLHAGDVLEEAA
jgi:hypothetical protein